MNILFVRNGINQTQTRNIILYYNTRKKSKQYDKNTIVIKRLKRFNIIRHV